ncbi:hypothetical protein GCM10020229_67100 [Kitasatospora albolonga]
MEPPMAARGSAWTGAPERAAAGGMRGSRPVFSFMGSSGWVAAGAGSASGGGGGGTGGWVLFFSGPTRRLPGFPGSWSVAGWAFRGARNPVRFKDGRTEGAAGLLPSFLGWAGNTNY